MRLRLTERGRPHRVARATAVLLVIQEKPPDGVSYEKPAGYRPAADDSVGADRPGIKAARLMQLDSGSIVASANVLENFLLRRIENLLLFGSKNDTELLKGCYA